MIFKQFGPDFLRGRGIHGRIKRAKRTGRMGSMFTAQFTKTAETAVSKARYLKERPFGYFLLSVLAGCIICNISARSLKMWYSQDEAVANIVIAISEYLDGADESGAGSNVLYLVDGAGEFKLDETTDTYMDHIRNFCYVDSSFILGLDPVTKLVVSDTEIRERNLDGLYTDLNSIDYYVIENTIDPASYNLDNVEPVPELSQGFYTVYRNTDPTTIAVK